MQAIDAGRAECSSTRYVSDTSEWSQVSGIAARYREGFCSIFNGCPINAAAEA